MAGVLGFALFRIPCLQTRVSRCFLHTPALTFYPHLGTIARATLLSAYLLVAQRASGSPFSFLCSIVSWVDSLR